MPTLCNIANNVGQIPLAAAYVPGSRIMVLNAPASSLKIAPPFRISVITDGTYGEIIETITIFAVSAVVDATPAAGKCTLTVAVDEGTTDRSYAIGDLVDMRPTAGAIMDFNAAVNSILNPYQPPAFTSFAISGQATTLEVGSQIAAGSKTFTWATSNSGNVAANSIIITDVSTSTVLGTGLANSGSRAITISAITNNAPATHTWSISGQDVENTTFSDNFLVSWLWRVYAGVSTNQTVASSDILAFGVSGLQSTVGGTYALAAGGYKYFCVPTSFTQPVSFKDQATGFNVPMADTTANAAYSNINPSGINYAIVSVTSATGVTTNYAVYRSYNQLGSTLNLVVA